MSHIHELIDYIVACYIVHDGRVLLCNHRKLKMWVPIGGHIELHEQPIEALRREIKEETGLTGIKLITRKSDYLNREGSQLPAPMFLDHHQFNVGVHWHTGLIYAGVSDTDQVRLAPDEHKELRWFEFDEMKTLAETNESVRQYSRFSILAYYSLADGRDDWKTEVL